MNVTYYRLNELKIIETSNNHLWWQSHYGFGGFREGKCYKKGCILFIGPVEEEGDGSLKGEFIESLRPFPQWYKTIYYCRNFEIYHCYTGKSLS